VTDAEVTDQIDRADRFRDELPTPVAQRRGPYSLGTSSTITTRVMPSAAFLADI
jgi:hypothetical protein